MKNTERWERWKIILGGRDEKLKVGEMKEIKGGRDEK